ncbi:hypothetical protein MAR_007014 [Mya arenaria]|uniref:Uncharacterized protein n=1 Tax=Mya arenaria TaxID=6604 RepID=A0ABY7DEP2_MYAAR|nr:hypothetical protein MAR_007014 [Mya arenaria]
MAVFSDHVTVSIFAVVLTITVLSMAVCTDNISMDVHLCFSLAISALTTSSIDTGQEEREWSPHLDERVVTSFH